MTGFTPLKAQYFHDSFLIGEEAETHSSTPNFVDDFKFLISAPTRINEQSISAITSLSVITLGIMGGIDTPVYNKSRRYHESFSFHVLSAPGRFYDSVDPSLFTYSVSATVIGSGYLFDDRRLARTGWTAMEAILATKLATGFLKLFMGRERPFVEDGNLDFDLMAINGGNSQRSFPSGHTSKIFALSTVLASSYDTPWVRIPAYALAGSVAFQRIESGEHWMSDVVVGAAIGYFIGRALAKQNGLVESNSRIYPVVRGGIVGLNVKF